MEPVTLILDTTSRLFLKWVAKYARAWYGLSWPVDDGTLSLGSSEYNALAENAAAEWFVPGIMHYPVPGKPYATQGDMTVYYPIHVVQFTVTPLTDKSIEVVAECISDPRAEGLLHEILAEIAQRWPDARAQSAVIDEVATGSRRSPGVQRLEERPDWPDRLRTLEEWERLCAKRPQAIAADLVGVPLRTLTGWRKRRDALSRRE